MINREIPDAKRILIDDVLLAPSDAHALQTLDATVLNAYTMTSTLICLLDAHEYGCGGTTLLIVVGRSGRIVESYVKDRYFGDLKVVYAHAVSWSRNGSIPEITTSSLDWNPIIDPRIETVVTLDDVISTGRTLELLAERNAWRFPRARWCASVWITRKKRLKGYSEIDAAVLATNADGKRVPINSLSTLRDNPEMAVQYAHKHFGSSSHIFHQALRGES